MLPAPNLNGLSPAQLETAGKIAALAFDIAAYRAISFESAVHGVLVALRGVEADFQELEHSEEFVRFLDRMSERARLILP